jgi:hypothetical protein
MKRARSTRAHADADHEPKRLAQLLDGWQEAQSTPQGLAASALAGAIGGLAFGSHRSRRFREARAWCWNDDRRDPLAFVNQCDILGIAPSTLRQHLREFCRNRPTRAHRAHLRGAQRTSPSGHRGGKRIRQGNRPGDVA